MNKFVEHDELFNVIVDVLEKDGKFPFNPDGKSMLPTIVGGKDSVLLIKPDEIKKNDIVFAKKSNDTLVMHRVVGIDNDIVILRGDNNLYNEEPISKNQIFAVVSEIYKYGRTIKRGDNEYCLGLFSKLKRALRKLKYKTKMLIKKQ